MDCKLVLLALSCLVIDAFAIEPALEAALSTLKSKKQLTINHELVFRIPQILKEYGVGYIEFNNLTIYGLDTINVASLTSDVTSDEDRFNLHVNFSFAELGVHSNYNVDMGILDALPIYGEGDFRLGFNETNVNLNLIMITEIFPYNISISDFDLKFIMRHSNQNYIRNFWKNEEVSNILSGLINDIEPLFCAWYDYNSECIDCLLSRIIQIIADMVLYHRKNSHIKCRCLSKITDEMQNILDGFLQALDSNTVQVWIKDTLNKPTTRKLARKIYDNILLTVKEQI